MSVHLIAGDAVFVDLILMSTLVFPIGIQRFVLQKQLIFFFFFFFFEATSESPI